MLKIGAQIRLYTRELNSIPNLRRPSDGRPRLLTDMRLFDELMNSCTLVETDKYGDCGVDSVRILLQHHLGRTRTCQQAKRLQHCAVNCCFLLISPPVQLRDSAVAAVLVDNGSGGFRPLVHDSLASGMRRGPYDGTEVLRVKVPECGEANLLWGQEMRVARTWADEAFFKARG